MMQANGSFKNLMLPFLAGLTLLAMNSGCATLDRWDPSRWTEALGTVVADYETAERLSAESGRELLIYYRDTRPGVKDDTVKALKDRDIKRRFKGYVCCHLFKQYEPDRRYVAQFGVERAPSLIVVHHDGTYHSLSGLLTPPTIARFLDEANAPGTKAVWDRYVPRRVEYSWHRSPSTAYDAAAREDRPVLFVFHRWWSRDWNRMDNLLDRREVHRRLSGLVHCRLSSLWPSGRREAKRFGITQWPALVIADPDGTCHVLELPISSEQIVQFAEKSRPPRPTADNASLTAAAEP